MSRIVENGWKLQQRFYPNRAIYEKGNMRRVINTLNGEIVTEYPLPLEYGKGGHRPGELRGLTDADAPPSRQSED